MIPLSAGAVEYTDCISALGQDPLPANDCPRYDIKQSDGEAPALEIWGMWCSPSLSSFSVPLWPGVVAPDRVLPMGQMEQTMN